MTGKKPVLSRSWYAVSSKLLLGNPLLDVVPTEKYSVIFSTYLHKWHAYHLGIAACLSNGLIVIYISCLSDGGALSNIIVSIVDVRIEKD